MQADLNSCGQTLRETLKLLRKIKGCLKNKHSKLKKDMGFFCCLIRSFVKETKKTNKEKKTFGYGNKNEGCLDHLCVIQVTLWFVYFNFSNYEGNQN